MNSDEKKSVTFELCVMSGTRRTTVVNVLPYKKFKST